jgi:hypothetical protein
MFHAIRVKTDFKQTKQPSKASARRKPLLYKNSGVPFTLSFCLCLIERVCKE